MQILVVIATAYLLLSDLNILTHLRYFTCPAEIPCMCYTSKRAPHGGELRTTLQVFSVKIAEISGNLQWPINVFGMIALRDSLDQNRNIIFSRARDNCQTLTEKICCISLPRYFFNILWSYGVSVVISNIISHSPYVIGIVITVPKMHC